MSHFVRRALASPLRDRPRIKALVKSAEDRYESWRHSLAAHVPGIIRPRPYKVMIAVTANCNAGCTGCRYGRDFMPGSVLETDLALDAIEDAAKAGFHSIRLYGGEPLLHKDLPLMVKRCVELGMRPYVTTNAALLDQKIDALVDAGLRDVTVGFYGIGKKYDDYVGRPGLFKKVEGGIAAVRERHGDTVDMQLNYLLKRPSCTVEELDESWRFALHYQMPIRVDLVHYSLPYFQEGEERELQFRAGDRAMVDAVVESLLQKKASHPDMLAHTPEGLRSIPDWLLKGPDMRVPCTAYEMIWIGADGTVQMCYVTFEMGNLHEQRLSEMLFTKTHKCAAKAAFELDCPNCHCSSNERVMRHRPSRLSYK